MVWRCARGPAGSFRRCEAGPLQWVYYHAPAVLGDAAGVAVGHVFNVGVALLRVADRRHERPLARPEHLYHVQEADLVTRLDDVPVDRAKVCDRATADRLRACGYRRIGAVN